MTKIKNHPLLIFLLIFFGSVFLLLLKNHMLEPFPDGLHSSSFTWADLAIHLDYISGFKERGLAIIFDNPIYAGSKMAYPFIPDLTTAFLSNFMPINFALIIPTFIFCVSSVAAIYLVTFKITKNKISAFLAPLIFFFNGSVVGFFIFLQEKPDIFNMTKEYAHLADFNIRFSNVIADYILPQRTFIWGLFLGLVAINFLWQKKYHKYAIVVALMPLVHTHTFLTFAMISALSFLLNPSKKFLSALFLMFALSIVQIPLLLKPSHSHFFTWHFGWMAEGENIFIFWLKNLAMPLILLVPAFFHANQKLRKFAVPFLVIFLVTNLIQFQPHSYDNMKIMLWSFLIICILISNWLVNLKPIFIIIAMFFLTATGALSVYRETTISWLMYPNEDIQFADFLKKNTNKEALFLTSDKHNNPVNSLAGRKVFLGFKGWLWTHGIDYSERDRITSEIYQGTTNAKTLLNQNKINYVVLEKDKYQSLFINEPFFRKNFPLVYQSNNYLLFKTSSGRELRIK